MSHQYKKEIREYEEKCAKERKKKEEKELKQRVKNQEDEINRLKQMLKGNNIDNNQTMFPMETQSMNDGVDKQVY